MAIRQYIGARYVPKFFENSETGDSTWASNTFYEALTMVTWNNLTYTSKIPVPASVGNPASAPQYWVITSNVNAQIDQLQQEVGELSDSVEDIDGRVEDVEGVLNGKFENDVLKLSAGGTGANSAAGAREALGLGSLALEDTAPISKGGTGANNAAGARSALGLGAVALEDVLPINKGGTGATNAQQARLNLGASLIEYGTDGLWKYRKYDDGTYDAWYEGNINLNTGTAYAGGYSHQSTAALTPPSFSTNVTSMTGAANSGVITAYLGRANDYTTYWFNGVAAAVNNLAVRIDMHGTWE